MNTELDTKNVKGETLFQPFIDTDSPESSAMRSNFQTRVENELAEYGDLSFAERMQRINTILAEETPLIKDSNPAKFREHGVTVREIQIDPETVEINKRMGFNNEYKQTAKNGLAQVVDRLNAYIEGDAEHTDELKTLAKRTRLANVVYNIMTLNQPYTDLNKQRSRLIAFSYIPLNNYNIRDIESSSFKIFDNDTNEPINPELSKVDPLSDELIKLQKVKAFVDHFTQTGIIDEDAKKKAIEVLASIPEIDVSAVDRLNDDDILGLSEGVMRTIESQLRKDPQNRPFDLERLTKDIDLGNDKNKLRGYLLNYIATPQGEQFLLNYINGKKVKPSSHIDQTEEQIQEALRATFRKTYPHIRASFKESKIATISRALAPQDYQSFPFSDEFLIDPANQVRGEELLLMKGRSGDEKLNMKKRLVYHTSVSTQALRNPLISNLRSAKKIETIYKMLNTEYDRTVNFCGADPLMVDCLSIVNEGLSTSDTISQLRDRLQSEGIDITDEETEFVGPRVQTDLANNKWTLTMDNIAKTSVFEHLKGIFRLAYERKIQQRYGLNNKLEIKSAIFSNVPEMPIQELIAEQLLSVLTAVKVGNDK